MITLTSCPVCGSDSIVEYKSVGARPSINTELFPGTYVEAAIISKYYECKLCHLIFQNPRMSDEELDRYYGDGYYRKFLNMTDEQMNDDELSRANVDAEIINEFVGKVDSHLDIGSSRGYLLKSVGAKVRVGVEPNIGYAKASGVKIYKHINEVPQNKYDLVTAIHVLEHVSDPMFYLKKMAMLTGKDGHVVIEVPTWHSPGGPLRLAHLYHFEHGVIEMMCGDAGLKIVRARFTPHLVIICKLLDRP